MAAQSWYTPQPGQAGTGPYAAQQPPGSERPLGELFSDMTQSLQTLVRKEVELAKVEVKDSASRAGKAGAMFAGAGVAGLLGVLLLLFAAAWGLAEAIPAGLAFLAVGLIVVVVAGLLATVGKRKMAAVQPPTQTVKTLKEDVEIAKTSFSRGASY